MTGSRGQTPFARRGACVLCAVLLVALAASASEPQTAPRADDTLTLVSGERLSGRLVAIDGNGQVSFEVDGAARTVPLESCEMLTRGSITAPARPPTPTRVWLRTGAVLEAAVTGGQGTEVALQIAFASNGARMAMRYLKAFRSMSESEQDGGFAQALDKPLPDKDLLFVAQPGQKPQRLSVVCKGLADQELVIEFSGQERKVPLDRIYGIVFAKNSGTPPAVQPMPRSVIELGDRTRFEGKLTTWSGEANTTLRLDEGIELAFPTAFIASLRVRSDKLAYLSDMTPTKVEQTPAFDRIWPWTRDAAPLGAAILLHGKEFPRGLVLIPRTRLTFEISGRFEAFRATIGIDDRSGPRAHAVFRVLGDGKVLAEHVAITHGSEPIALDIPIAGVQRLALEADFGANFDLGDHCAFAAARLVKS